MSIIAEFTVPADEFALYDTLCEVPEMTVNIEHVVAHDEEHLVPYFWTSGENYTEFGQKRRTIPQSGNSQSSMRLKKRIYTELSG